MADPNGKADDSEGRTERMAVIKERLRILSICMLVTVDVAKRVSLGKCLEVQRWGDEEVEDGGWMGLDGCCGLISADLPSCRRHRRVLFARDSLGG